MGREGGSRAREGAGPRREDLARKEGLEKRGSGREEVLGGWRAR